MFNFFKKKFYLRRMNEQNDWGVSDNPGHQSLSITVSSLQEGHALLCAIRDHVFDSRTRPGPLADHQIQDLASRGGITPMPGDRMPGTISYGFSSFGYDARLGRKFKIFTPTYNTLIDPKNFDAKSFVEIEDDHCIIPPNSFALAETLETFIIPRDVIVICLGKSTYARCGLIVNVTPLEPSWEGKVTLELSNTSPLPLKVYAEEGIAQFIYLRGSTNCRTSYADKKGKYQNQTGITLPFVKQ